jgi:hypothetical protein
MERSIAVFAMGVTHWLPLESRSSEKERVSFDCAQDKFRPATTRPALDDAMRRLAGVLCGALRVFPAGLRWGGGWLLIAD